MTVLLRMSRPLLLGAIALLAACAQTPPPPPPPEPKAPVVEPPPEPERPADRVKPATAPVITAQGRAEAQKLATRAVDPLNAGDESTARRDLERALSLDPENKLAASLMRQITEDPTALFGLQYFTHRVERDESLSMIAGRFLGDIYLFYGLARYNDIRVPRQVAVGQAIKVPGKAPPSRPPPIAGSGGKPPAKAPPGKREPEPPPAQPEPPRPEPTPVPASAGQKAYDRGVQLLKSGDRDNAYEAFREAVRLEPQNREAASQRDKVRQELIQHNTREATVALQRQNVTASIKHWSRVLELDPNNASAKSNLDRARELDKRLKDFPEKK